MQGATEYARLFRTGQYGKLYLVSSSHARGSTFRIQILPEGKKAEPNGDNNLCLNDDAVVVYGIVGGHPGWTERYGWLETGRWMDDFEKLVKETKNLLAEKSQKSLEDRTKTEDEKQKIKEALLSGY